MPPRVSKMSCVYVLRWPDGVFYVGESDNLVDRIAYHRSKGRREMRRGLEAIYVPIPKEEGSKSMARRIEASVIEDFNRNNYKLLSDGDARNVNFGSS